MPLRNESDRNRPSDSGVNMLAGDSMPESSKPAESGFTPASQHDLALFIQQAPVAIAMFDREMNYLAVSQRWVEAFGRGRQTLVGLNHYDVSPDLPERWINVNRRALAGETLSHKEDLWVRTEGSSQWLQWDARPWRDANSQIGGIILYAEDITLQQEALIELRNEKERLQALLRSAQDAIVLADQNGIITDVNAATTRLLGYDKERLVGQHFNAIFPLESGNIFPAIAERSHELGIEVATDNMPLGMTIRRPDGILTPVELTKSYDPGLNFFILILRDATERRNLERLILNAAEAEQQRVGQELHDGVQQELTAMTLMSAMLVEQLQAATESQSCSPQLARAKQIAQKLKFNLEEAGRHIRDLAHGLVPMQVQAHGLQAALTNIVEPMTCDCRMQCTLSCAPECDIEDGNTATHLFRICQEAIANAQRHSRATQLRISLSQQAEGMLLEITDNGCGFEVSAPQHQLGLGLRSMQYRAALIGGEVTVRSRPNDGTTVRCIVRKPTLPIDK